MIHITKIYLVTNCYGDPNKVYIGKEKSHKDLKRENNHKRKFGKQIEFTFIDQVKGWKKEKWIPIESFYINYFKFLEFEVLNKNNGRGGPSFHTSETRKKLSKNNKGRKFSKEWLNKLSKAKKGTPKPKGFGIAHSLKMKGKPHPSKWKPVLQYDLDMNLIKEFKNVKEIISKKITCTVYLMKCLKNKSKSAGGFIWRYK